MRTKKRSHQSGTVYLVRHKRLPDAWYFRAREYFEDGSSHRPSEYLGDTRELPTKADAEHKVLEKGLLQRFNSVVFCATSVTSIRRHSATRVPKALSQSTAMRPSPGTC